ncbi:hypothetical protein MKX01_029858 [Papaver californicum]|nr:hypothetical protein MKX01_029858 [Papaver californicum]
MHGSKQPSCNQYLAGPGIFAPAHEETPPHPNLPVNGYLPEGLNGEFLMVGPNPKFMPVAGYHWQVRHNLNNWSNFCGYEST